MITNEEIIDNNIIEITEDNDSDESIYFDDENTENLIETILILMDEYISENPTAISEIDFHEVFLENIISLINVQLEDECKDTELEEELNNIIEEAVLIFYDTIIPERSLSDSIILNKPNIEQITEQINYLKNLPQPEQRTKEWYEFRKNLITASNAYKAFENQNVQNQLIYEKCYEQEIKSSASQININTPFHWGQKYEPVSVMVYEYLYNTKIGDFGCIKHPEYNFLGASPDGINIDVTSDRYGRMLEIKNIVNREIDGIPKKEYWIQTQLQMETCNLDECDFLETLFVEYENEEQFLEDGTFFTSNESEMKGVIMYFSNNEGNPYYIYKPIDMDKEEFTEWEEEKIDNLKMTWIKNIYWKLKKISCVLIQRNRKWFQDNIEQLRNIWNIIETERKTGFEHRAPVKRIKLDNPINDVSQITGCFLNLSKLNN
jgi:putative phage-type endonuclease